MLIQHLAPFDIEPVYSDQDVLAASAWAAIYGEKSIPVADRDSGRFLGVINENELPADPDAPLSPELIQPALALRLDQPLLDVWRLLPLSDPVVLPVTDVDSCVVGCIHVSEIYRAFGTVFGLDKEGVTILIECDIRDAHLSGILRLIEAEGTTVFGLGSEVLEEDVLVRISVRMAEANADRAVGALRRHGYVVYAGFRSEDASEWEMRADHVLRFLDL